MCSKYIYHSIWNSEYIWGGSICSFKEKKIIHFDLQYRLHLNFETRNDNLHDLHKLKQCPIQSNGLDCLWTLK